MDPGTLAIPRTYHHPWAAELSRFCTTWRCPRDSCPLKCTPRAAKQTGISHLLSPLGFDIILVLLTPFWVKSSRKFKCLSLTAFLKYGTLNQWGMIWKRAVGLRSGWPLFADQAGINRVVARNCSVLSYRLTDRCSFTPWSHHLCLGCKGTSGSCWEHNCEGECCSYHL